jgi:hypothetical protein
MYAVPGLKFNSYNWLYFWTVLVPRFGGTAFFLGKIMESSKADRDLIKNVDGLYYHFLDDDEKESLEKCIKDKFAIRSYEGIGALMGLSKVRVISD